MVAENAVSTDGAIVEHAPLKYVNCNVLQNQNLAIQRNHTLCNNFTAFIQNKSNDTILNHQISKKLALFQLKFRFSVFK